MSSSTARQHLLFHIATFWVVTCMEEWEGVDVTTEVGNFVCNAHNMLKSIIFLVLGMKLVTNPSWRHGSRNVNVARLVSWSSFCTRKNKSVCSTAYISMCSKVKTSCTTWEPGEVIFRVPSEMRNDYQSRVLINQQCSDSKYSVTKQYTCSGVSRSWLLYILDHFNSYSVIFWKNTGQFVRKEGFCNVSNGAFG